MFEKLFGIWSKKDANNEKDYLANPREILNLKRGQARDALVRAYVEYRIREKSGRIGLEFIKALPNTEEQKSAILRIGGLRDLTTEELGILNSKAGEYEKIRKERRTGSALSIGRRMLASNILRLASLAGPASAGMESAYAQQSANTFTREAKPIRIEKLLEQFGTGYEWYKLRNDFDNIAKQENSNQLNNVDGSVRQKFIVGLENLQRSYKAWEGHINEIKAELNRLQTNLEGVLNGEAHRTLASYEEKLRASSAFVYDQIKSDGILRKESLEFSNALSIDGNPSQFHSRFSLWLKKVQDNIDKYTKAYTQKVSIGEPDSSYNSNMTKGPESRSSDGGHNGAQAERAEENRNANIDSLADWDNFRRNVPETLRVWLEPWLQKQKDPTLGIKRSDMDLGRSYQQFKDAYLRHLKVTEAAKNVLENGAGGQMDDFKKADNDLRKSADQFVAAMEKLHSVYMGIWHENGEGGMSRDKLGEAERSFNSWLGSVENEVVGKTERNSDTLVGIYNKKALESAPDTERRTPPPVGRESAGSPGPLNAYGEPVDAANRQPKREPVRRGLDLSGSVELSKEDVSKLSKDEILRYERNRAKYLKQEGDRLQSEISHKKKRKKAEETHSKKVSKEIPAAKAKMDKAEKRLEKLRKEAGK